MSEPDETELQTDRELWNIANRAQRKQADLPLWYTGFPLFVIVCRFAGFAILAAWLAWGIIPAGWRYVNRAGWIEHTQITTVYMDGNWLTGEYRTCETPGNVSFLSCPKAGDDPETITPNPKCIYCDANARSFSVGFYGDITGKPEDTSHWQCKRETDSITCRAVQ